MEYYDKTANEELAELKHSAGIDEINKDTMYKFLGEVYYRYQADLFDMGLTVRKSIKNLKALKEKENN